MPDPKNFVRAQDFSRFEKQFTQYRDNVDRVTDVLLVGYKNEANHLLRSKVNRTEVEDMNKVKFDKDRGRNLEGDM